MPRKSAQRPERTSAETEQKGATSKTPASSATKGARTAEPDSGSGPVFRHLSDPRKARETGLYETMPFRLNQTTYKTPKNDKFNIIE